MSNEKSNDRVHASSELNETKKGFELSDKIVKSAQQSQQRIQQEQQPQQQKQQDDNVPKKYPKVVFLIILNEFCERFSYYGLKTVLYLYLTKFIGQDDNTATSIYHAFTMLCYFSPLMGAILADGFIGLYKTILYVSVVYFVGEVILCLTSMAPLGAPNLAGPVIALVIIAIGTGG